MKKLMMSLLAALVMATVVLPVTAAPVRAEEVQVADEVVQNPDDGDEQESSGNDSEWKYVPVRRYFSAASSSSDTSTNYFDGKLLSADDLTTEQQH